MANNNGKIRLYDIYEKIGRLEGTLQVHCKKVDDGLREHGSRINKLEEKVDNFKGKATVFGFLAGFLGSIVIILIRLLKGD